MTFIAEDGGETVADLIFGGGHLVGLRRTDGLELAAVFADSGDYGLGPGICLEIRKLDPNLQAAGVPGRHDVYHLCCHIDVHLLEESGFNPHCDVLMFL